MTQKHDKKGKKHGIRKNRRTIQGFAQQGLSEGAMNTDYTATRMLGYLYRYTNPKIEDLVDEMLAILSDRAQIIEKKESEHAQAVISEMYRNGLG